MLNQVDVQSIFDTWYLGGTRNDPFLNSLIDWLLINGAFILPDFLHDNFWFTTAYGKNGVISTDHLFLFLFIVRFCSGKSN